MTLHHRTTADVSTSAAALSPDQEVVLRPLAALTAALAFTHGAHTTPHIAVASAYSPETSGHINGCDGSTLHDADLTFASLAVPCGTRVRFCVGRRCVIGVRKDSGPYVPGRLFDLNLGLVRALGFPSCLSFGVRSVTWRYA